MKRLFITVVLLLAACLSALTYLGYFGGALFIEVPATVTKSGAPPEVTAVVLSGDMGFSTGMAAKVADRLAAKGIPSIGVNSLVFFRVQRTPREVEQMLTAAIHKARAFGHTDRVVLIGQSFGADMIPPGLALMPADIRKKIVMVALVVPTDTLFYRASPSELFNWSAPDANALPTAKMLDWIPVTCVSGREETDSLCPHMNGANVRGIELPGGHGLHRNADLVGRVLVDAIVRAGIKVTHITKDSGA